MIGKTLGHYEIFEPLSADGMGGIHRSEAARSGCKVAIKVLPAVFAAPATSGHSKTDLHPEGRSRMQPRARPGVAAALMRPVPTREGPLRRATEVPAHPTTAGPVSFTAA